MTCRMHIYFRFWIFRKLFLPHPYQSRSILWSLHSLFWVSLLSPSPINILYLCPASISPSANTVWYLLSSVLCYFWFMRSAVAFGCYSGRANRAYSKWKKGRHQLMSHLHNTITVDPFLCLSGLNLDSKISESADQKASVCSNRLRHTYICTILLSLMKWGVSLATSSPSSCSRRQPATNWPVTTWPPALPLALGWQLPGWCFHFVEGL